MSFTQIQTGPQRLGDDALTVLRGGKDGEAMLSQMNARYYEQTYRGRIFCASATGIAANVIYSTAAGTGGPLIWNPPASGVNVVLLKVGFGVTTVSSVATTIGVTGAGGQLLIPGSTTAIDGPVKSTLIPGGPPSQVLAFRIGTPTVVGAFFMGLFSVAIQTGTGATTTIPPTSDAMVLAFVDLEGSIICQPGGWLSCSSGAATATSMVSNCSAMWAEVPI